MYNRVRMVKWSLVYTKQSGKDAKKFKKFGLDEKVKKLLNIIKINSYQNPPIYEKLVGDLNRAYSRRINIQHRLVYEILEDIRIIKIIRMWSHYGD